MVENVARDVRDQFVANGETENVSRGAESTDKQRGKHHGSITINNQDMRDGQDNDHHLGPILRCNNKGGRSMGSTDIAAVVPTRGGVARASQIWHDGGCDRILEVLAPGLSTTEGGETIRQVGKLLETPAKTHDGEARLPEGGKDPARESSGEGGNGQEDGRAEEQGLQDRPRMEALPKDNV